jgi:hypothetical protein
MRVLVCGGRDFSNCKLVFDTLNDLSRKEVVDCIIEGDAPGADRIAGAWAKRRRVDLKLYPANWAKEGKAAGPRRNQKMLDEGKPDLVVAFPGGTGTADMVSRARAANVEVIEVSAPIGVSIRP